MDMFSCDRADDNIIIRTTVNYTYDSKMHGNMAIPFLPWTGEQM